MLRLLFALFTTLFLGRTDAEQAHNNTVLDAQVAPRVDKSFMMFVEMLRYCVV